MLRSSLRGFTHDPLSLLAGAGIEPTRRAEELDIGQFQRLAELHLEGRRPGEGRRRRHSRASSPQWHSSTPLAAASSMQLAVKRWLDATRARLACWCERAATTSCTA